MKILDEYFMKREQTLYCAQVYDFIADSLHHYDS